MTRSKILVADDNLAINKMVVLYFQEAGFEVISAFNGKDAVEKEEAARPDLVMLDVEMPVMNGFEACKVIREKRSGINYVPIIFLSGSVEENLISKGLLLGADDFVQKPYNHLELLSRVNNLIKMKNFIAQVESLENVVTAMLKSIEARDFYTAGHSQRVSELAMQIADKMGISKTDKEILNKGAMLHDIGKIGISDMILNKPGKLTEEEFKHIEEHSGIGEKICGSLRFPPLVLEIIRHHHEKNDGSGYPDKLRGDEIHQLVMIVAVADIYDALTTARPYRKARKEKEAILIIEQEVLKGELDPAVLNCLKKLKAF